MIKVLKFITETEKHRYGTVESWMTDRNDQPDNFSQDTWKGQWNEKSEWPASIPGGEKLWKIKLI